MFQYFNDLVYNITIIPLNQRLCQHFNDYLSFNDLNSVKYLPFGKCEIIHFVNCEIWCFRIKWNEINPLTPAGISHCEAIFHTRSVFHKSRKGFISLKKTWALYQRTGLFLAEKEGFEPSIPFWGIHDFQSCALGQLRDFSVRRSFNRLSILLHLCRFVKT